MPVPRPVHRARPWLLALAFWAALVPLAEGPLDRRVSGNVWSRLMTIESMVERGTFAIERSPMLGPSGSPDIAKYDGHTYADKPPVLSILGALAYAPLHFLAGWSFPAPGRGLGQLLRIHWTLTALFAGGGSAWALASTRRLLQLTDFRPWVADLLTLALGFGSLLLIYGVTFNNHSVAAGLITAAFAGVALEDPARPRPRRGWVGFCAGLAATIDLPAGGATFLVLGIWLAARARAIPWSYLLGAVGPALLHVAAQMAISGSPLPIELDRRSMEYRGSYWTTPAGRFVETGPRWRFGLELLVGPQGWLTITPALFLTPIGLLFTARRGPLAGLARSTAALLALLLAFYIWGVRRTDYAGLSFGVRHLLAVTPLAFVFAAAAVDRSRSRRAATGFAALIAVGIAYASVGMTNPWTRADGVKGPRGLAVPRPEPLLKFLQNLVLAPHTSYTRW